MRSRRAFTLFELVIALTILVILTAGICATVQATLSASGALRETQHRQQGVYGFLELCGQAFTSLPPGSGLATAVRKDNETTELLLHDAPNAFGFGTAGFFYGEIALTCHRQDNGGLRLGLEYRKVDRWTKQVQPNPVWLPLLSDVKEVSWEFFDPSSNGWVVNWESFDRRPRCIRLTLSFLGNESPWQQSFWLPELLAPLPVQPAAAPTAPKS